MGTFGGLLAGLAIGFVVGMIAHQYKTQEQTQDRNLTHETDLQDNSKTDDQSNLSNPIADTEQIKRTTSVSVNQNAAKKTFLDNINVFIPKFNSLLDGSYSGNAWTEDVITINDENLTAFWKQIYRDGNAVLRVLSMWGIKPDMCTSFVANETYQNMYTKSDGTTIALNERYNVAKQCWILSQTNEENKVVKSVLVKGEVE